ncbi:hypothetical protein BC830DRAFT_1234171 [Chytriomyces sp. MP71]|nr:hypothetical protein BC830DRAFT_1234171 [Chytriomyces sp. MP71]
MRSTTQPYTTASYGSGYPSGASGYKQGYGYGDPRAVEREREVVPPPLRTTSSSTSVGSSASRAYAQSPLGFASVSSSGAPPNVNPQRHQRAASDTRFSALGYPSYTGERGERGGGGYAGVTGVGYSRDPLPLKDPYTSPTPFSPFSNQLRDNSEDSESRRSNTPQQSTYQHPSQYQPHSLNHQVPPQRVFSPEISLHHGGGSRASSYHPAASSPHVGGNTFSDSESIHGYESFGGRNTYSSVSAFSREHIGAVGIGAGSIRPATASARYSTGASVGVGVPSRYLTWDPRSTPTSAATPLNPNTRFAPTPSRGPHTHPGSAAAAYPAPPQRTASDPDAFFHRTSAVTLGDVPRRRVEFGSAEVLEDTESIASSGARASTRPTLTPQYPSRPGSAAGSAIAGPMSPRMRARSSEPGHLGVQEGAAAHSSLPPALGSNSRLIQGLLERTASVGGMLGKEGRPAVGVQGSTAATTAIPLARSPLTKVAGSTEKGSVQGKENAAGPAVNGTPAPTAEAGTPKPMASTLLQSTSSALARPCSAQSHVDKSFRRLGASRDVSKGAPPEPAHQGDTLAAEIESARQSVGQLEKRFSTSPGLPQQRQQMVKTASVDRGTFEASVAYMSRNLRQAARTAIEMHKILRIDTALEAHKLAMLRNMAEGHVSQLRALDNMLEVLRSTEGVNILVEPI